MSATELTLKHFKSSEMRFPLRLMERSDGIILFLGSDVANALGFKKYDKMYNRLEVDEKILLTPKNVNNENLTLNSKMELTPDISLTKREKNTQSEELNSKMELTPNEMVSQQTFEKILKYFMLSKNTPHLIFINESGLYNAIFRSRKEEAIRFKKWVTSEVLPQIRKTGTYDASKQAGLNLALEEYIKLYNKLKREYMTLSQKYKEKNETVFELEKKILKMKRIIFEIL